MTYTTHCINCNEEITWEIEPLIRGRYSGPPEKCYPDEGGFAYPIEAIEVNNILCCPTCQRPLPDGGLVYAEFETLQDDSYEPPDWD